MAVGVREPVVRLGAVDVELAVPVPGRVAQVDRSPGHGWVPGNAQVVAAAVRAVEVLPAPEALGRVQESRAAQHRVGADRVGVRERPGEPLDVQRVRRNRVLVRVCLEHRSGQAHVGRVRDLVVEARLQRDRVALVGSQAELGLHVLDVIVELPPSVSLLVQVVGDPAHRLVAVASAQRRLAHEQAPLPALEVHLAVELRGRLRRDEIHQPPDRLRAMGDLAAALQHLDPAHPLDRRGVVHVGLPVGRQRDRNAVLQHQHLAAAVGVQAAHADVEPHRHRPRVFPQVDAGNAPQHLVRVDRLRGGQVLFANQMQGTGYRRAQVLQRRHHFDGRPVALDLGHLDRQRGRLSIALDLDRLEVLRRDPHGECPVGHVVQAVLAECVGDRGLPAFDDLYRRSCNRIAVGIGQVAADHAALQGRGKQQQSRQSGGSRTQEGQYHGLCRLD